jgi:hypothetical protein
MHVRVQWVDQVVALGWAATSTFGLLRAEATRKTRSTPLCHVQTTQTSHTQKNALPSCFRVDKFLPVWWKSTIVTPRSPLQVLHVRRVVSLRHHGQSRGDVQRAPPFPAGPMTLCAFTSCAHPEGVDSRCTAGETDDCACLPLCAALWGLSAHARAWCGGDGWGVDKTTNHACVGVADGHPFQGQRMNLLKSGGDESGGAIVANQRAAKKLWIDTRRVSERLAARRASHACAIACTL